MKILDFEQIKGLGLTAEEMFQWTCEVWERQDTFISPPRVFTWLGESGRFATMPCIMPNEDMAGVKFLSRNVDSVEEPPMRNSNIMLQRISQHGLYAVLDGTWITTMRTGACAYFHASRFSKSCPETLAVYGLGVAARAFMFFWYNLYKRPITVKLLPYKDQHLKFMERYPENGRVKYRVVDSLEELLHSDIIVSCVSYARSVLCEDTGVYPAGCTIVPVHTAGFQNCDPVFDKVFVDDIGHVQESRHREGFKAHTTRITEVARGEKPGRENDAERILVYNGGLAIFDLHWAMKIIERAGDRAPDIPMAYPRERFWI